MGLPILVLRCRKPIRRAAKNTCRSRPSTLLSSALHAQVSTSTYLVVVALNVCLRSHLTFWNTLARRNPANTQYSTKFEFVENHKVFNSHTLHLA